MKSQVFKDGFQQENYKFFVDTLHVKCMILSITFHNNPRGFKKAIKI